MKLTVCLLGLPFLAISTSTLASPVQLKSYDQLNQALARGETVSAIVHINQCTANAPTPDWGKDPDTRLNFNVFSNAKVDGRNTIATSINMLVENPETHQLVSGYSRLRIFEDNSAVFHMANFKPGTYEPAGPAIDWNCKVNDGVNSGAVVLYDYDRSWVAN